METYCSYSYPQISGKKDGSIEARYDALEAENAKLKKEMKSKDSLIVKQAVKINEMESRSSNDDDDIDENMKEVEAELKAELEETQTKMKDERKLFGEQIDALKSTVATRDNKINELEQQLSAFKIVNSELEIKNDKLEDENRKYEAKIYEMKCQIDDLMQEDAASEARATEARHKIEFRDNEIKELKELLSCAKDVNVESNTKIDILEDEKKEFEARINELKLQVDELTQKVINFQSDEKPASEISPLVEALLNQVQDAKTKNPTSPGYFRAQVQEASVKTPPPAVAATASVSPQIQGTPISVKKPIRIQKPRTQSDEESTEQAPIGKWKKISLPLRTDSDEW